MKKLLITVFLLHYITFADDIKPLTKEFIPFQFEINNYLTGVSVDIVRQIQQRLKNKNEIKLLLGNRAYEETIKNKNTMFFLVKKTKQNEKQFKWVGPIITTKFAFFKNRYRTDLEINSIDDAKKVGSIIVAKDTSSYEKLNKLGFGNLEVMSLANNDFIKLIEHEVDLYFTEYYTFRYELKALELGGKIVPINIKENLSKQSYYFAFNINTSDDVIKSWQSSFDAIKNDGTIKKILENYR